MPLYLAYKMHYFKYDANKFVDWYLKLPDISHKYKTGPKTLKYRLIFLSGYYFWLVYILACFIVVFQNPLVAVISLLISPFVVGGYVYCEVYFFNYLKRIDKFIKK